jgi:hypothetical protein
MSKPPLKGHSVSLSTAARRSREYSNCRKQAVTLKTPVNERRRTLKRCTAYFQRYQINHRGPRPKGSSVFECKTNGLRQNQWLQPSAMAIGHQIQPPIRHQTPSSVI